MVEHNVQRTVVGLKIGYAAYLCGREYTAIERKVLGNMKFGTCLRG